MGLGEADGSRVLLLGQNLTPEERALALETFRPMLQSA